MIVGPHFPAFSCSCWWNGFLDSLVATRSNVTSWWVPLNSYVQEWLQSCFSNCGMFEPRKSIKPKGRCVVLLPAFGQELHMVHTFSTVGSYWEVTHRLSIANHKDCHFKFKLRLESYRKLKRNNLCVSNHILASSDCVQPWNEEWLSHLSRRQSSFIVTYVFQCPFFITNLVM